MFNTYMYLTLIMLTKFMHVHVHILNAIDNVMQAYTRPIVFVVSLLRGNFWIEMIAFIISWHRFKFIYSITLSLLTLNEKKQWIVYCRPDVTKQ